MKEELTTSLLRRETDYRVIKKLLNHAPVISSDVYYINDDGNLWTFHKDRDGLRIHANMITKKGKAVIKSAKKAFEWVFMNTDYKTVYANIPKQNRAACLIARQCMNFINADKERHYYEVTHV